MQISVCLERFFIGMALMLILFVSTAHAEVASVYGGRDGYCGSRTANGGRVNCSAMTAAHRRLPFGTRVRVCHSHLAREFASVTVDASQFALTIAAPGSGVEILIYHRRRPELLVWMALGMSQFRDCEGHRTRSKKSVVGRLMSSTRISGSPAPAVVRVHRSRQFVPLERVDVSCPERSTQQHGH
jgi:hypothetical protein